MLISSVGDERGGEARSSRGSRDYSFEYQTASELLDLMTRNASFNPREADALTTQDLILLYKNIDIGSKLLKDAKRQTSNQHVETVVYKDDRDSDSDDIAESISSEDISFFVKANQERLDFFDSASYENLLFPKIGGIKIKTVESTYRPEFSLADAFIQSQLNSMNITSETTLNTFLPTSLFDYLCCKKLENNYNFYLDNIITHVQHTIDQLKRISDGDYLTDKAKEKWKEVKGEEYSNVSDTKHTGMKILANSTSIPFHVECKNNIKLKWDDIVHSEIDIRSLSKIIEKKIVLEIPKMLCGSYKLFSKRYEENVIISCREEKRHDEGDKKESRVDLVVRLQRSQTGQVMSNIRSIMILQSPAPLQDNCSKILPLTYKDEVKTEANIVENKEVETPKLTKDENKIVLKLTEVFTESESPIDSKFPNSSDFNENSIDFFECFTSNEELSPQFEDSSDSKLNGNMSPLVCFKEDTKPIKLVTRAAGDMKLNEQELTMPMTLVEENPDDVLNQSQNKRKSPVRVRIKSPYENKSFILEEKKRKKLLEIREKREKKKMAIGDTKCSKNKYAKPIVPQASSSVTKLSITNKSFYNSIYGQKINVDNNSVNKLKIPKSKDDMPNETPIVDMQGEVYSPNSEPNSKKFINRSYYLDEAETEMMMMKNVSDHHNYSTSASTLSNEMNNSLNVLSHFMESTDDLDSEANDTMQKSENDENLLKKYRINSPRSTNVPLNTPKGAEEEDFVNKKNPSPVECRKSIDKLYDLMRKLSSATDIDLSISKQGLNLTDGVASHSAPEPSPQDSDSGTSIKHQKPVIKAGIRKLILEKQHIHHKNDSRKPNIVQNVTPKVVNTKLETDKLKKEHRRITVNKPASNNPIKAITQILNDIDQIQKHRQRPITTILEVNRPKRPDLLLSNDSRNGNLLRHSIYKGSKMDAIGQMKIEQGKEEENRKCSSPKDRKFIRKSPMTDKDRPRVAPQGDDKETDKLRKKKAPEFIDEEARGEAVRGPHLNSRLQSLAQPKKIYVKAHSEDYQNRYGRNIMAYRLQKLATKGMPSDEQGMTISNRNRVRRSGADPVSKGLPKSSTPAVPIDKCSTKTQSLSPCTSPNKVRNNNKPKLDAYECTIERNKSMTDESYPNSKEKYPSSHVSNKLNCLSATRVPLFPEDLTVDSSTTANSPDIDSSNLSNKIHCMVNSLMTSQSVTPQLGPLCEAESEYQFDIMSGLNVVTAVEIDANKYDHGDDSKKESAGSLKFTSNSKLVSAVTNLNAKNEIEKLENALCQKISGTFPKRLRLKNLTLTPKQSMQKIFLLQSGDAGSLLVESMSHVKVHCNESFREKDMTVISNSQLKWDYVQLPKQVATVGYTQIEQKESKTVNILKPTRICPAPENVAEDRRTDQTIYCPEVSHIIPLKSDESITLYNNGAARMTDFIMNHIRNSVFDAREESVNKITTTILETKVNEKHNQSCDEVNVTKIKDLKENHDIGASTDSNKFTFDGKSSLDALVGLLNEIQKITCQSPVLKSDNNFKMSASNATEEKELKVEMLGQISMTSLDKLRHLESNSSICSFVVSNNGSVVDSSPDCIEDKYRKTFYEDKEVYVNIGKELMSTHTDMSSKLIPVTMNCSTHVTKSLVGIRSEPSNQSLFAFNDQYHTLYFNNVFEDKKFNKIIELPQNDDNMVDQKSTKKINKIKKPSVNKGKANIITTMNKACKMNGCIENIDLDPLLKMKRDILVTVYSILMFTVFAALSFPGIIVLEG